jgi:predicted Zn-dependent protease
MRLLSGILKFFITLIFLGGLVYAFRDYIPFLAPAPCTEPIRYSLGTFDPKFDISQKEFLDALQKAEAVWEKPYGKELFQYAPEDNSFHALKINLIYDYRQQATEKLSKIGTTVDDKQAEYDSLKAKFETLKISYEKEKREFEAKLAAWNKSSRTDKKEYDELQIMQADVNAKADQINALVASINRLAGILNLSVEKYNNINETRGESFEEGVYSEEGLKREIDIYEFTNEEKLVRVLAHELGHALHLDHVSDPKAIMYEFNEGNNTSLTAADLVELKAKCEKK